MAKPKPIGFKWKKMPTPFHGKAYRVWGEVEEEGKLKRKQFWFATEKEAKAVTADRNQEQAAYGSKVNLDSEARLEAFRASELLKGSGATILDAVRFYLEHQKQASASGPFSELAAKIRVEFKRRLEENEVSDRHSESLNETLRKLETRFGEQLVSEIQTEDIREWLSGLHWRRRPGTNTEDTPVRSSISPSTMVTSRRIRLPRSRDSTNAAPKTTKSRFSPPTKPSDYFGSQTQWLFLF